MFVTIDAYENCLKIIVVSNQFFPEHNPVTVQVYKDRRLIFEKATVRLCRVWSLGGVFESLKRIILNLFRRTPECKVFVPRWCRALEIPKNLSGCFDCSVKVLSPGGKELEIRSFMIQGKEFSRE